jgi:hypothetical protein
MWSQRYSSRNSAISTGGSSCVATNSCRSSSTECSRAKTRSRLAMSATWRRTDRPDLDHGTATASMTAGAVKPGAAATRGGAEGRGLLGKSQQQIGLRRGDRAREYRRLTRNPDSDSAQTSMVSTFSNRVSSSNVVILAQTGSDRRAGSPMPRPTSIAVVRRAGLWPQRNDLLAACGRRLRPSERPRHLRFEPESGEQPGS